MCVPMCVCADMWVWVVLGGCVGGVGRGGKCGCGCGMCRCVGVCNCGCVCMWLLTYRCVRVCAIVWVCILCRSSLNRDP